MVPVSTQAHGSSAPAGATAPPREHPDILIARIAGGQDDVASRRQLIAAGVSEDAIRHRVRVQRFQVLHAGVYKVGPGRPTARARTLAAVLACGEGAVLSHRSAGAAWGLRPSSSPRIEVTVPRARPRRQRGIAVYGTRRLYGDEVAECDGVPCTSVARTLVDLAGVVSERDLSRTLERSVVLRLFDLAAVQAALGRAQHCRGAQLLGRKLAELADDPPFTRSELERRFLELVAAAGLPAPVVNGIVCGHEVDFHWPKLRFVVETDGAETHATRPAFERDRARDLDLELAGWHVVRITWRQVVLQPERVVALLRTLRDP